MGCPSVDNWTEFFDWELQFLAHDRNIICAINFLMQVGAFMDKPEIVVPN